jgi:hypothetical protein
VQLQRNIYRQRFKFLNILSRTNVVNLKENLWGTSGNEAGGAQGMGCDLSEILSSKVEYDYTLLILF